MEGNPNLRAEFHKTDLNNLDLIPKTENTIV